VTPLPEKPCSLCGRRITWRRKWSRDWDSVRYCSDRCRRARGRPDDRRSVEAAVLALLAGASICPSEVARQLEPEAWRDWVEPVRAAGRRLAAAGLVEWTQQGRIVDPSTARGPVRLRRPRR
jgi:hypothetical protein